MNKWKQTIMDNIFMRNACSDLFGRYFLVKERGKFIPFIQYKIGHPENDWFLYFRKPPYPHEYVRAFIKKLLQLNQQDATEFLLFHYKAYHNKEECVRWIKLTLIEALSKIHGLQSRFLATKAIIWAQRESDLLEFEKALRAEIGHMLRPTYAEPGDLMESEVLEIADHLSSGVQNRLLISRNHLHLL